MPNTISADEKRWQAEDDARAMAQAEEVKADKARLDAAQQAAKRMADEETKRAQAMRKVAGRKSEKSGRASGSATNTRPLKNEFGEFER